MAKSDRGFASMIKTPQGRRRQKEIAAKGGSTVSKDRAHMARIGRMGGQTISQNKEHMAEIGRKGGRS